MSPASASGYAQFLALTDGPTYTVMHYPEANAAVRPTAVLMVPPFGWDQTVSHRARRYWAIQLATAGFPTLRIDLPGTGQSHGDAHAGDLVGQWTRAVDEAGRWLLEQTPATRLAAIAVGTGGLVTLQALAAGAPIDDLVLWAVKGRGRAAVRELTAYAGVVASEHPDDAEGPAPADGIDVTGYLLADTTMEDLSAIDVARLDFPEPERRRALLLSRDQLGVDERLNTALVDAGMHVESVDVADYADLMSHPQIITARRPTSTIARTIRWLGQPTATTPTPQTTPTAATTTADRPPQTHAVDTARMPFGAEVIHEAILNITLGGEAATAVVSMPDEKVPRAPVGALLLNAGTIDKDGPHRMWVALARRWASRGIVSVRADFGAVGDAAGIGDDGGDERPAVTTEALTSPPMVAKTQELIELLRQRGIVDRVVLVGHCSGAYLGFHTAVAHDGVDAFFAVNQQAFEYSPELVHERMFERIVTVARGGIVRRLREQGLTASEVRQVMHAVRHRYRPGRSESVELSQSRTGLFLLDQLRDRGVRVLMLFSQEGTFHRVIFGPEFQADVQTGRWPNAEIEELPTEDHMARAIWLQRLTQARLDVAMDAVLSGSLSQASAVR